MAQYSTGQIQSMIVAEAQRQGIDPALALAVAQHESSFDPNALGTAGDAGLFQLIPVTQKEMGVTDPFDVLQNIQGGVGYLKKMLAANGGDETLALEAYNGGEPHVLKGNVSTAATQYADTIMGLIPGAKSILAALGLGGGASSSPAPVDASAGDTGGDTILSAGFLPAIDLSSVASVPAPVWWGLGALAAYLVVDLLFGGRR